MRQDRRPSHITVLTLYTLLTAVMTWPLAINLTKAIPGDGFDGWQNYWNQWWIKTALIDRIQNPLTTDLLYAPTGVGLYFHTLNPFNGLLTLPIQLTGGLILAYNAVVFFSWVMGGYGLYLLVRWLLRNPSDSKSPAPHLKKQRWDKTFLRNNTHAPAFLAGLIFTFSPIHMAHLLGHMQVMSLEWIPFYVLALMRSLDQARNGKPWLRTAIFAGFFLALVGLCDWYFVLYLFFFTGLLIGWHLLADLLRAHQFTIRPFITWILPPATAGVVFLVLLSPMLLPMIREASTSSFMVRPTTDLYILSASIMDFFIPTRLHTLFRPGSFEWIGNQIAPVSERTIGVGYLPLILTFCAAFLDRKRVGFWLGCAAFFFFMALGPAIQPANISFEDVPAAVDPFSAAKSVDLIGEAGESTGWLNGWTPFAVLNKIVPFMRISRSVSRYALMVQLAVAVAAGIGLATLLQRMNRSGVATVFSLLLPLILLAEYWVAPYPLSPPDTPQFYETLRDQSGDGSVLNLPMNYDRPGYLLYQTIHQKPLSIAYISRDDPRTLTERVPLLQHLRHLGPDILDIDPVVVGPTILSTYGVEYVILDRYKMPGGKEREYTTDLIEAIFHDKLPLYEDDRLTVYQVAAGPAKQYYFWLEAGGWGPLQTVNDGKRYRALLDQPAILNLGSNYPRDARLRLRYRTTAEISNSEPAFTISNAVGNQPDDDILIVDAAPDGGEIEFALSNLLDGTENHFIALHALEADSVFVEQISVVQTDLDKYQ